MSYSTFFKMSYSTSQHLQSVDEAAASLWSTPVKVKSRQKTPKARKLTIDASSADMNSLIEAGLTHSWNCSVCEKVFANKESFKTHMKGHFGKLDHKCSICSKLFWKKTDLEAHIASIHYNQKTFHCEMCGKSYAYKRSFQLHLKTRHLNNEDNKQSLVHEKKKIHDDC